MKQANGFYSTPLGAFSTWEEAATACERSDLDPCDCIKYVAPVDVAWIFEYGMESKLSTPVRCF